MKVWGSERGKPLLEDHRAEIILACACYLSKLSQSRQPFRLCLQHDHLTRDFGRSDEVLRHMSKGLMVDQIRRREPRYIHAEGDSRGRAQRQFRSTANI